MAITFSHGYARWGYGSECGGFAAFLDRVCHTIGTRYVDVIGYDLHNWATEIKPVPFEDDFFSYVT